MIFEPSDEDIVEAQKQGDITALLLATAGITPKAPRQRQASEPEAPCYHIARPGAWPCGTAASGPMPGPRCPDCTPAA